MQSILRSFKLYNQVKYLNSYIKWFSIAFYEIFGLKLGICKLVFKTLVLEILWMISELMANSSEIENVSERI